VGRNCSATNAAVADGRSELVGVEGFPDKVIGA
jgi:hypothetical protein